MDKKNNKEITDFLRQPENFDTALEIYESFPLVLAELQSKFWLSLKRRVETLVKQSPNEFDKWDYGLKEGTPEDNYFSFDIMPKTATVSTLYCSPSIQQQTRASKYQLFCGICWNEQVGDNEPSFVEFEELRRKVRDDLKLSNRGSGWWVGGTFLVHRLRDRDTLKQLVRDDSLEHLMADQLVELFKATRDLLEKVNDNLSK